MYIMKTAKLVQKVTLAFILICLLIITGCPYNTTDNRIPSPKVVGEWKLEGNTGLTAGTVGKIDDKNYLFLGLRILDLSNPERPVDVGKSKDSSAGMGIKLVNKTLFVSTIDSILIVDVSDPSAPKTLSKLPVPYFFGSMDVLGKNAFIGTNNNIVVVDISDLSNPKVINSLKVSDQRHVSTIVFWNSLLAVALFDGVHIYEVSQTGDIKQIGLFPNTYGDDYAYTIGKSLAISGKYAYFASGTSGLRVIDLSNPSSPTEIGKLKTQGSAIRILVSGNLAYIIDMRGDLSPRNHHSLYCYRGYF